MTIATVKATHSYIIHFHTVALNLIQIAESEPDGTKFKFCFGAMTFSALAIEALANVAGSQIIKEWHYFESASPLAKVILISKHLDIDTDFSVEPWQTLSAMIKFRNSVAHCKPEKSKKSIDLESEANINRIPIYPDKPLENMMTIENAKKFDKCMGELQGMWQWGARNKNLPLTFYDSYETTVS